MVPESWMGGLGDVDMTSTEHTGISKGDIVDASKSLYIPDSETTIFDLYCVGYGEMLAKSVPFVHMVSLMGPKGKVVRMSLMMGQC